MSDLPIDVRSLRRSGRPNQCLALPAGLPSSGGADIRSPVFRTPPRLLRDAFDAAVADEPRLDVVEETPDRLQLRLVQRSRWLRFPDEVTVAFVALDGRTSSLAIWSRSRYGQLDFGVNRGRVRRWLDRLTEVQRNAPDA